MKLDILIPCHNDCVDAEKLLDSLVEQRRRPDSALIIHNGCTSRDNALPVANKAMAVNHGASMLHGDYVVCLDADVSLSPYFLAAIETAIVRDKLEAGAGLVLVKDKRGQWRGAGSAMLFYNGAAVFVKRDLLLEQPIPTDCVVEDTDYLLFLQKSKRKVQLVPDAVAYEEPTHRSLSFDIRRQIRYAQGGLQLLAKRRCYRFGISTLGYAIATTGLYALVIWLLGQSAWQLAIILYLVLFLCCASNFSSLGPRQALVMGFAGPIVPFAAIAACLLRKRVW